MRCFFGMEAKHSRCEVSMRHFQVSSPFASADTVKTQEFLSTAKLEPIITSIFEGKGSEG